MKCSRNGCDFGFSRFTPKTSTPLLQKLKLIYYLPGGLPVLISFINVSLGLYKSIEIDRAFIVNLGQHYIELCQPGKSAIMIFLMAFFLDPNPDCKVECLKSCCSESSPPRYAEFFEKRLISQEISGRAVDLEEIQEEKDTTPSEIPSNIPQEVEGFEPPQEEDIPIRRSERRRQAPNRLSLNVEMEEHSLGDLNEPTSYKAAMLDSESNMWIDAMNAEI
ncbi:retrotransposon protein, putative, ty1-copia subclass [Tanacetum coccineum]